MHSRKLVVLLAVLALALSASLWAGNKKKPKNSDKSPAVPQMDERQRALHALNRLTFGPRPGDVDRVSAMGVDKWIDQQLHPEKIDDTAIEARLQPLRTLKMSTRAMIEQFPPPQVIKAVESGRMSVPKDPAERAIYEAQIQRYQQRQENKQAKGNNAGNAANDAQGQADDQSMMTEEQRAAQREQRMYVREQAQKIMDMPPDQRMKAILALDPQDRQMMSRMLRPEDREQLMNSLTPQQREQLMAMNNPQQVVATELMQGKLLRAAYSERQLQEVMTDFWYNHFNVFIGKGPDRYMITEYERDVIRPHALGKFKDLLMATAKSPAMLFYLDNWQSVGPNSPAGTGQPRAQNRPFRRFGQNRPFGGPFGRPFPQTGQQVPRPNPQQQQQAQNRPKRGLNENYARELMELHTLGVDGGYTQKDVTEVARVFSGWTIKEPRRGGDFDFNERMHEPGM